MLRGPQMCFATLACSVANPFLTHHFMRCPKALDEASKVAIGKPNFNPGIIILIPALTIGFPRQVWRSKTGPLETQVIFVTIIRSSIRLSEKYNCKYHFSFHQLWPSLKNMFSEILRGFAFRLLSEILRGF